ncbi:transposase domain-containing protein [Enterococcus sp. 079]|nr:transposase domain-containing protein [Enterococcus sp. 079]
MHSTSLEGARTSGIILSVYKTAELNGLNPVKYLEFLFDKIPNLPVLSAETLDQLLPWNKDVQQHFLVTKNAKHSRFYSILFFRSKEEFESMIEAGEMLEYAEYVGNYYGTPFVIYQQDIDEGKDVFLEIEVKEQNKSRKKCLMVYSSFLTPPDLAELKSRIVGRGTDADEVIEERMKVAKKKSK